MTAINNLLFRVYGAVHLLAKTVSGRRTLEGQSIFRVGRYKFCKAKEDWAPGKWRIFLDKSEIKLHSSFRGFHYAGYVLEKQEWCLDSWIWTNAALVRAYVAIGKIEDALSLGNLLASRQQPCGGWIVRNDYDSKGAVPVLAPNDSAYIANNAFISLFKATDDIKYLEIAEKCARWIMSTCREDGMLRTGLNMRDQVWIEDNVIVDVGFAAALFANLYDITNKEEYKDFLRRFVDRYIELFYDTDFKGFATSINKNNRQQGGYFGRGQAWALEGLIPAYIVLRDKGIEKVIDETVARLLESQNRDGSWPYNLSRRLMGDDCKGASVIAKSLAAWYAVKPTPALLESVKLGYSWCCRHTLASGEAAGGIFSFCIEGGIVKNLYSSCAFVYASAYAIELDKFINSQNDQ